ncbi:MAG: phosphoribosylglycinamide formyltransferase [Ilumatobacteraceae bacterium]
MKRLVVLASGEGTNLQAILDACANATIDAAVVAVVSNKAAAPCLARGRAAGAAAIHVGTAPSGVESRAEYDARLAAAVLAIAPDYVVCAGWMRILSMAFLEHFDHRVINIHPSLPGELIGADAIRRAYSEHTHGTRTATGVMVHYIVDEGVDDGPLIDHVEVEMRPDESLGSLTERMHVVEHRLLVDTLAHLCATGGPP